MDALESVSRPVCSQRKELEVTVPFFAKSGLLLVGLSFSSCIPQ